MRRDLGSVQRGLAAVLISSGLLLSPAVLRAGVFIGITVAPPVLPVYVQPPCPSEGYIWTPGFWQWDPEMADYYWVPGTWVAAPQPGYLWTPGYWAYSGDSYGWHDGYWGPHVGFYGGVNYGFGYFGSGFEGGRWERDRFFYNTAYSRVNVTNIHNTYINKVTVNNYHNNFNRVSYNGGNGIQAQPGRTEQVAMREQHLQPTQMQQTHFAVARQDRSQFATANHGAPPAAALLRPAANVTSFHQTAVPARPLSVGASTLASGSGLNRIGSPSGAGAVNAPASNRGQFTTGGPVGGNRRGLVNVPGGSPAPVNRSVYGGSAASTVPPARGGYGAGDAYGHQGSVPMQGNGSARTVPQQPMTQQQRPQYQQPHMQQRQPYQQPSQVQQRQPAQQVPQMQQRQPYQQSSQVQPRRQADIARPEPAAHPVPEIRGGKGGGGGREMRPR